MGYRFNLWSMKEMNVGLKLVCNISIPIQIYHKPYGKRKQLNGVYLKFPIRNGLAWKLPALSVLEWRRLITIIPLYLSRGRMSDYFEVIAFSEVVHRASLEVQEVHKIIVADIAVLISLQSVRISLSISRFTRSYENTSIYTGKKN